MSCHSHLRVLLCPVVLSVQSGHRKVLPQPTGRLNRTQESRTTLSAASTHRTPRLRRRIGGRSTLRRATRVLRSCLIDCAGRHIVLIHRLVRSPRFQGSLVVLCVRDAVRLCKSLASCQGVLLTAARLYLCWRPAGPARLGVSHQV